MSNIDKPPYDFPSDDEVDESHPDFVTVYDALCVWIANNHLEQQMQHLCRDQADAYMSQFYQHLVTTQPDLVARIEREMAGEPWELALLRYQDEFD